LGTTASRSKKTEGEFIVFHQNKWVPLTADLGNLFHGKDRPPAMRLQTGADLSPRGRTDFFQVSRAVFDYVDRIENYGLAVYLLLCHLSRARPTFTVEREWLCKTLGLAVYEVVDRLAALGDAGLIEYDELTETIEVSLLVPGTNDLLVRHAPGTWFWLNDYVVGRLLPHIGISAFIVLAGLASRVGGRDERCVVEMDELARSVGLAGRSSLQRPFKHLDRERLVAALARHVIRDGEFRTNGRECWVSGGKAGRRENIFVLLDRRDLRPGARSRSSISTVAYNLERRWVKGYQWVHGTPVEPVVHFQRNSNLRKLVGKLMRRSQRSPEEVEEFLEDVFDLVGRHGFPLPDPDTLAYDFHRIQALPGYADLDAKLLRR
jgi:hypothetical protein